MDTPEKSQSEAAPASHFEDSPFSNFINSLSPIQPCKSEHIVQAYTSPGFSSIYSVFASPHANLPKESRFSLSLRHPYLESSRKEDLYANGVESSLSLGIAKGASSSKCIVVPRKKNEVKQSYVEDNVKGHEELSTLSSKLPQFIQYDCGSPNHNIPPCYGTKHDLRLGVGGSGVEPVKCNQDGLKPLGKRKSVFAGDIIQDEKLNSSDADDLLVLHDPDELEACKAQNGKLGDGNANLVASLSSKLEEDIVVDLQKKQPDAAFGPCVENTTQDPLVIHGEEFGKQDELDQSHQNLHKLEAISENEVVTSNECQKVVNGTGECLPFDTQVDSQQQRGIRRRCLNFEASAASKRSLNNDLDRHPSNSSKCNKKFDYNRGNLSTLITLRASPSPCILPGIGLHLNSISTTSNNRMISQDTIANNIPCSITPFPLKTAESRSLEKSLIVENDIDSTGSEAQNLQIVVHDAFLASQPGTGEELSQNVPKKKRRKSDNSGESEACKRCNCKKSKCLKLYCECFAAGVYCSEPCSCQGCYNKPVHEETVLSTRKQIESRNPLAFAPKVIRTSDTVQDMGEELNKTPASARHKRGCNCKKSSCLKKYCECFQGGVGCCISCRCEGCKNVFGRKDGNEAMDTYDKEKLDDCQEASDARNCEHHSSDSILVATPLEACRTPAEPPFVSFKPPRSSTFSIAYSPLLNTCQSLRKSEDTQHQRKFSKHGDDIPQVLGDGGSTRNCVKTSSPNGKRVSSPHIGTGPSPSRKGGRKMILKAIPSFPSLTCEVTGEHPESVSSGLFESSFNQGSKLA